jgi:hypothetical protein
VKTCNVLASAKWIRIVVIGGRNYYARGLWATDPQLLMEPPGIARTPNNYSESPIIHVGNKTPTYAEPMEITCDTSWWKGVRETQRNVYCLVQWTSAPNRPWNTLNTLQFVINHIPVADAGPDQVITLDAQGQVPADILLDGTASDDIDLHMPVHPAPGPLAYRWSAIQIPPALAQNNPIWAGAQGIQATANPIFLSAGTPVPNTGIGIYTFRLQVDDNEKDTVSVRAGRTGTATADTRVLLGLAGGNDLSIASPTTAIPYFGNHEDGVDVAIYYTVNPPITNQAAYQNGWMVRCAIFQSIESPVIPSIAVGQKVFEITQAPLPFGVQVIHWDGIDTASTLAGSKPVGAFKLRLELLDAGGNTILGPNGQPVPGSVVEQDRAIILDFVRWLLPVRMAQTKATLSGSFMESGHGQHLHRAIDIIQTGMDPPPDIVAARSGYYQEFNDGSNSIAITHPAPDRTRYLHSSQRAGYAAGTLALQGAYLGRMDKVGTGGVHLHFEHRLMLGQEQFENPLGIITLKDNFPPSIDAVFVRDAQAGGAADLTNGANSISGLAHLIVRCRDKAHPDRRPSPVENGPYRVRVVEKNGIAFWPTVAFSRCTAANQVSEFFALQGLGGVGNPLHHYLPYILWNTYAYQGRGAPLFLEVWADDFVGNSTKRDIVIGPDAVSMSGPPDPAIDSTAPAPFDIAISVTNMTEGLNSDHNNNTTFYGSDDYHLDLDNAPGTWTVARVGAPVGSEKRTGSINNKATKGMTLRIDPHGQATPGTYVFDIVVSSNILLNLGSRVKVTARVI